MSDRPCCSCNDLKDHAPDFVLNGVTDDVCKSLQKDTGLNSHAETLHDDCEDLELANDCLIGNLNDEIDKFEEECNCENKVNFLYKFIKKSIPNVFNVIKANICAICGLWTNVHNIWEEIKKLKDEIAKLKDEIAKLKDRITKVENKISQLISALSEEGYVAVVRVRRVTIPVSRFTQIASANGNEGEHNLGGIKYYFGAAGGEPAYDITVNVSEMDDVQTVIAQTRVVGLRQCPQTVAIQGWYVKGDYIHIDFDPYEITEMIADPSAPVPYALPIDFVVIGKKKLV